MKIPFSGLTGPVLNFANAVQRGFDQLISIPSRIVDETADLPPAASNQGRRFIIRDIGAGVEGEATALDGTWHTRSLT